MTHGVLAIGGGLAAQRFCETLRRRGYDGRITIVSDEPVRPYDRPPLSKQFLAGDTSADAISFRSASWYADNGVDLVLDDAAVALDAERRVVRLASGDRLGYEDLLVATGAAPRRLPIADGFENVHYLRTLADAKALKATLFGGMRLVIVGAGFIGQEVAATARRLGTDVTIVEALATPLERIVGASLGRWFADLHRAEGVRLLLGRTITRFRGGDAVGELELDDGSRVPCDAVVVGVGVAPVTGWLAGAGPFEHGVPVDEHGRSTIPHLLAAGDAALTFEPALGTHVRCDHWEAAARQGAAAGAGLLALPGPDPVPTSFWSDQYDVRIQYVGHAARAERIEIDGDPESRDFTAVFMRGSDPIGALLVGRPRELPAFRRLLRTDAPPGGTDAPDTDALLAAG